MGAETGLAPPRPRGIRQRPRVKNTSQVPAHGVCTCAGDRGTEFPHKGVVSEQGTVPTACDMPKSIISAPIYIEYFLLGSRLLRSCHTCLAPSTPLALPRVEICSVSFPSRIDGRRCVSILVSQLRIWYRVSVFPPSLHHDERLLLAPEWTQVHRERPSKMRLRTTMSISQSLSSSKRSNNFCIRIPTCP